MPAAHGDLCVDGHIPEAQHEHDQHDRDLTGAALTDAVRGGTQQEMVAANHLNDGGRRRGCCWPRILKLGRIANFISTQSSPASKSASVW